MGWGLFGYYHFWFILTLLTLPGAAIAFLVKKNNWLSVAVLSVANVYLASSSVSYFYMAMARFPHHLLSSVFCLALAVFFVFVLFDDKKHRLAALAIILAMLIASAIILKPVKNQEIILGDGEWTCDVGNESVATAEINDGNHVNIHAEGEGNTLMTFENADGEIAEYSISVYNGGILADLIE